LNTAKILKNILKTNRKISHLDLRKNPIGDNGLLEIAPALRCASGLVHIDFSSNELGPEGAEILFKSLLGNNCITSIDISSHEGLHRNHLSEKGLKKLVPLLQSNKILSILNLSGNSIKSEGLAYIAQGIKGNFTLSSLKICQNEIQGVSATVQNLKAIIIESKLMELDISDNPLGNSCMENLSQLLSNGGMALRRFYFCNIGINSGCILTLFKNLRACSVLKTLRMDKNQIAGPEFKQAISELLNQYSCLENLTLHECNLGDEAGSHLFRALNMGNHSLKTLGLTKNILALQTAKEFSDCLQKPFIELKIVDLSYNKFDDECAVEISKGLKNNNLMQVLNLSNNMLYTEAGKIFVETIKANTHLEKLILRFNSINNKYVTEIEQRADLNAANARKRKVPIYKQEINAIVVDEELADELEWKAEQIIQQQKVVENEFEQDLKAFEQFKKEQAEKYEIVKNVFDNVLEAEQGMNIKFNEINKTEEKVKKESDRRLSALGEKLSVLQNSISQIQLSGLFSSMISHSK